MHAGDAVTVMMMSKLYHVLINITQHATKRTLISLLSVN